MFGLLDLNADGQLNSADLAYQEKNVPRLLGVKRAVIFNLTS
jgi:hypothetical protein